MTGPPWDLGGGALLRRYRIEDLDALWEAIEQDRERIGRWMPWVEGARTKEDERAFLDRVLAKEAGLDGLGIWVHGEFAGGIGLMVDPFTVAGEIGYWIRSTYEGRGLVTKATQVLIDHAFDEVGVHRVVIRAGVENTRSRAIPERLGFTNEGVAREEGRGTEGFYDLVVYGLLDREWHAR